MKTINTTKELGALIRQERKVQKLTQAELASLTGVGIRYLREFERGKETIQFGLALQVMRALGIHLTARSRKDELS